MCYIFRCFGWALDVLQRLITFLLACVMTCVICIGLTLAVGAGIAFGYNYSLAEFLTFTRSSDVTVYVRRGQFADRPDVRPNSRRLGDDGQSIVEDGNELFSSNFTADYQEQNKSPSDDSKPLSDAWQKSQDSRAYAEKLSKYSKIKAAVRVYPRAEEEEEMVTKLSQPTEPDDDSSMYHEDERQDNHYNNTRTISTSITDLPLSRRNFDPNDSNILRMITRTEANVNTDAMSDVPVTIKNKKHKHKKLRKPDIKIEVTDHSKSLYLRPHYNITRHSDQEYSADLDYMYKSV